MTAFSYQQDMGTPKRLGLIVLQSDETVEQDFRRFLPHDCHLHVSRVPSGTSVTADTLQAMAADLPRAASLFPSGLHFDAVGYGCTSGTAQIGADRIHALVSKGVDTRAVSEPVTALRAACAHLGVQRLAFLSPYIGEVSARLRDTLAADGLHSPVFGSFEEAEEHKVARIAPTSILKAGKALAAKGAVDGLFLSCTNLRTFDVIAPLEAEIGVPVLSSNQVLMWHLAHLAGIKIPPAGLGRLMGSPT